MFFFVTIFKARLPIASIFPVPLLTNTVTIQYYSLSSPISLTEQLAGYSSRRNANIVHIANFPRTREKHTGINTGILAIRLFLNGNSCKFSRGASFYK